jgi:hypothetical protein
MLIPKREKMTLVIGNNYIVRMKIGKGEYIAAVYRLVNSVAQIVKETFFRCTQMEKLIIISVK